MDRRKTIAPPPPDAASLIVREAMAVDAPQVAELICQLGYPETEADVAARMAALDPARTRVLVAELSGRVVGCLTISIMHVLHRPRPVGRISMMVVAEGLRGQRIGEQMVRAAEQRLAEAGCGLVEVTSNEKRVDAHRFYQRLGFQRTSLRFARDVGGKA